MGEDNLGKQRKQDPIEASKILTQRFYEFARPILRQLSQRLDRRLVQSFFALLLMIIIFSRRNRRASHADFFLAVAGLVNFRALGSLDWA